MTAKTMRSELWPGQATMLCLTVGLLAVTRLPARAAGELAETPKVGASKEARGPDWTSEATPKGYLSAFIPHLVGVDPKTGEILVRLGIHTTTISEEMLMAMRGVAPSFMAQLARDAKELGINITSDSKFKIISSDLPPRYRGLSVEEINNLLLPEDYYYSGKNGWGTIGGGMVTDAEGSGSIHEGHMKGLRAGAFEHIGDWVTNWRDIDPSREAPSREVLTRIDPTRTAVEIPVGISEGQRIAVEFPSDPSGGPIRVKIPIRIDATRTAVELPSDPGDAAGDPCDASCWANIGGVGGGF